MTRGPRRIAVVVDRPPRDLLAVKEQVDVLLALLALDQPTTVVFVGDGVHHCLAPDEPPERDPSAVFGSLDLYDVRQLVVEREALEQRGLAAARLRFAVDVWPRGEVEGLLRAQDLLL